MRASLLAVAVLATIAVSSAVDEECVQRKLRGLPIHWPNPTHCGSFYRCTNKNVKRELLCPAGKEYNPKSGRCAPLGKNLCKLSLKAALDGTTSPCANELSGTYVADVNSCRGFNICNNNLAYPQSCDAGSYFDTTSSACVPDTYTTCWENLCLTKGNGAYLANENDCYSFYICSNEVTVAQDCPSGSYFNKETLNCLPGVCPSDVTTEPCTTDVSTTPTPKEEDCPEDSTTTTTEACTDVTTIATTVACTDEVTTLATTEACTDEVTTLATTEACTDEVTTLATTETCTDAVTTLATTETCTDEVTTLATTEACTDEVTTLATTETCTDEVTTTSAVEVTTECSEETTTPANTTPCEDCSKSNCDQSKCLTASDYYVFEATSGNTKYCVCLNHEAVCRECIEGAVFQPDLGFCVTPEGTTPKENETTTPCSEETTTPPTPEDCLQHKCDPDKCKGEADFKSFPALDTTTGYCVCVNEQPEYRECADNAIYDEKLNVCVAQTVTSLAINCAGGYEEGDFAPNLENRMNFYICFDGELIETSCGIGNYYDTELKHCMPATKDKCPECTKDEPTKRRGKRSVTHPRSVKATCTGGLPDGAVTSNPANCSSYYVCCSTVLKEKFCNEGYYFNPESLKCEEDIKSVCWPRCTEGEVAANSDNCTSYYVCCNNQWKEQTCDEDSYFNVESNKCEVDVNYTCRPRCTEGEVTPNVDNCTSYYVCVNNDWKEQSCDDDSYFNVVSNKCEVDTNSTCRPRCTEGEVSPNADNCTSYYVCCNNEWKEESCDEDSYFNVVSNKCEVDTNYTCRPRCTKGEVTQNPDNCTSYYVCVNNDWKEQFCDEDSYFNVVSNKCEVDTNYTCRPRCTKGEVTQNPDNCTSYYVCVNNDWKEQFCDEDSYFNVASNKCEVDTNYTCRSRCTEGEVSPNADNCTSYYVCCNNEWKEQSCDDDSYFNVVSNKCEVDTNYTCRPRCTKGEVTQNPDNCTSYYVCVNNDWKEQSCDDDSYFNVASNKCEVDTNYTCRPRCTEGEVSPNADNCTSYYVCCNNEWKEQSCDEDSYFNVVSNKCEVDTNYTCRPRCTKGEVAQNPDNCTSYYVCVNNDWKEQFCDEDSYFNVVSNKCEVDTNSTCRPRCTEGEVSPNADNCTSYYVCCNNEWKEQSCDEDSYFNVVSNKCEVDTNYTCRPRCTKGEVAQNPDNCTSYYVCVNNDWKEQFCDEDSYFNVASNKCEVDTNYTCRPRCTEGEVSPNADNCTSYYVCCNNEWKEQSCDDDSYFNVVSNKCEVDTNYTCRPRCTKGEVTQNPDNCTSYYVCVNNDWKEQSCDDDSYFNVASNKCEVDTNYTCRPRCTEGEVSPNADNCTSYYVCCNNEWKEQSCDEDSYFNVVSNKCEVDTNYTCRPRCTKGEVAQNPDNCTSYYVCVNNDWKEQFCDEDSYFNVVSNKCEVDTNSTCRPRCTEGEVSPNADNCTSYYVCCNNEWKEQSCDEDSYFNVVSNKCEVDTNYTCRPRCTKGEVAQNPDNCTSYYVCVNNDWKEQFCDEDSYFNVASNKCEVDTNYTCRPRCTEGEVSPNADNCTSYYVCCNNEWKEQSCDDDSYFNVVSNKCEVDTNYTCRPRCTKGEVTQNPDNCTSYYVCVNNDWKEQSCDDDSYFNVASNKCEVDTNYTCRPRCTEGEVSPNADNCTSYYVCCNNEWKEQSCDEDSYFNVVSNKCEVDTNYTCRPRCTKGEVAQNPDNCTSYYVCVNNDWKEQFCDEDSYFNVVSNKCEVDTNSTCRPRCTEGEVSPNADNCTSYYVCCNNEWKEQSCDEDSYFNVVSNKCEVDTNYTCRPRCTKGEVTQNPDNCTSYYVCVNNDWKEQSCDDDSYFNVASNKCEVDTNYTCRPRCTEGEVSPNADNCTSYYVCCNNEWKEQSCDDDSYFNVVSNKCEVDTNYTCRPRCTKGEVTQNPDNCTSYYVCVNNDWKEQSCDDDSYFNVASNKCEVDTNSTCRPRCTEGEVSPNADNCTSYYVCCNNEWKEQSCDEDSYFNVVSNKCEVDTNYTCRPRCTKGEVTQNTDNCTSYYVCVNNDWKEQFCDEDSYFNVVSNKCEVDTNSTCRPRCTEGEVSPNADNCTSYYVCCNNEWKEQSCDEDSYFNVVSNKCEVDTNYTCRPRCTKGEVTQNTDNCTSYYVCVNNDWKEQFCDEDSYFNVVSNKCEVDTNSTCRPRCTEGEVSPNADNCTSYYVCCNNEWKEQSCDDDSYFNVVSNKCEVDTNYTCRPRCTKGEVTQNSDNCTSYYVCVNNDWKEQFCDEDSYFNVVSNKCEVDTNSTCRPRCTEGEVSPNADNCTSYYVCCNNEWKEQSCDEDSYFNVVSNKCEVDTNYTCRPRCTKGEVTQNPDNCTSYYVCVNNDWKEQFCDEDSYFNVVSNKCEVDTNSTCRPRCTEGEVSPNADNCTSYYVCCNNEWKEQSCDDDSYFNVVSNKCEVDTNYTCRPRCTKGEVTQNPDNCTSYYVCVNNDWKEQFCDDDSYFNVVSNKCEVDTNSTCRPRCTEGEVSPNADNCTSYYVCCNNDWKEQSCDDDSYFNVVSNKCEVDTNSTCRPRCTEGEVSPNADNCTSYFVCCNNEWKEETCDDDSYFNVVSNKCEVDTNSTCRPRCTEGEVSPNADNCTSYFVCCNNEWKEETCDDDSYFNVVSNKCEVDTNSTCRPRCKEGEVSPNADNCTSYYVCCNNEWKEETCDDDSYFNVVSNKCEVDSNSTCRPRCTEGEVSPNADNCTSYYVCCNNEWKEQSCDDDSYFNVVSNKCEVDTNSTCRPRCTEGEVSPNADNCTSYYVCCNNEWKEETCDDDSYFNVVSNKCEVDTNSTCRPRCTEGEVSPNADNCTSYFVCCNNEWKEETCDDDSYFNVVSNKCEVDTNSTCRPRCTEGEVSPNADNCTSYYVCCNNEWKEETCDDDSYFNVVSNKCEVDTNSTCRPRCTEGEVSPNADNCTSYYVCCNNEWKEETCDDDSYFNVVSNKCEVDTNSTCRPRCTEGEVSPNADNCTSYYVCCNNEWKEQSCDDDSYFNVVSNKCEVDTNSTCRPRCKEGEVSPNADNCTSYYVCCNNEWKEQSCDDDSYFNVVSNKCEVDTNSTCRPRCTEGEVSPNADNCTSYYVCCNNEWKEETCDDDSYFNVVSNKCEVDTNSTCRPRCKEGEVSPNADNCTSYYVCCNNEWKEETCDDDSYFNVVSNKCEVDTNSTCRPRCTEGEVSPNADNCTSYYVCCNNEWKEQSCDEDSYFNVVSNKCEEDVNNTCRTGCKDGEVSANTDNCTAYYVCCSNEWKEQFCKEGDYFNAETNACEPDIGNICVNKPTTCIAGEQVFSPTNCSAYLVCCSGAFKEQYCDVGSYFSNVTMKCEPDTENMCWVKEACTCTGGYANGTSLASDDCDKFYICSDGELILQDCGLNNYFNVSSGICEPDTEHTCWKNYCADQANGAMIANPKQCNAFYTCNNGESTDVLCPIGDWFDPSQSSCQPDVDAVCYNPCATEDKITVLPHPSCNKFYWCNGKHTLVGTCAVGGFNETIGSCDPTKSCTTNECNGKPNYYTYADPNNKTNFYVCMSGVPKLETCPQDTEFNGQVCAHVSNSDCDATLCLTSENYASYPTLNATDDTAFCFCHDGYATKYDCPAEYVYRADYGRCFTSAACDPMVCKNSDDLTVFVNHNDTNSFCMCVSNKPVVVPCPSGSFNPYTGSCTNVEMSDQCDQLVCRDQVNFLIYASKNSSFNGFCKCESKLGVLVDCPVNTVFDPSLGLCKLNFINCDSSKCKGVADNTKLAALTTTQGYCECVSGTATYYNCDNFGDFNVTTQECMAPVCDPSKCTAATLNTAFPATGTTTGFCMCTSDGVKYDECPEGGVFDIVVGSCRLPLPNCDNSMCVGQADNTKLPAWHTLTGYCSCLGGKVTYEDCQNDWVFDKETQTCNAEELPVEDRCDVSYCDDPTNAGKKYPSFSSIYGYCMCNGPTFAYCAEGEIFDAVNLECTPSADSQCDVSCCASATPDNTYSIPAKNNDTFFCFCSGPNNVMLLQCPSGKYYDNAQQLCVSAIEEGCSCPDGLQNGDRAPDSTNCTQYYVCNAGSMHQQSCPTGQYFNTDANCCRDNDGTCSPTQACTCMGAYREGERVTHPYNKQMYYVCEDKMLHERNCGSGRIFNKIINQCMKAPRMPGHSMHKRSATDDGEVRTLQKITNFFTKFLW